jgi:DNA-binding MarR family transcriptional regulator
LAPANANGIWMSSSFSTLGTLYLLHLLTHTTRTRLDSLLSDFALTAFQYTALTVIAHNPGLSSANLSSRFHVSAQAMGQIVIMLEQRGLISRREDAANRKILRLSVTPAGARLAKAGDSIVKKLERELFRECSAKDIAAARAVAIAVLTAAGQIGRNDALA